MNVIFSIHLAFLKKHFFKQCLKASGNLFLILLKFNLHLKLTTCGERKRFPWCHFKISYVVTEWFSFNITILAQNSKKCKPRQCRRNYLGSRSYKGQSTSVAQYTSPVESRPSHSCPAADLQSVGPPAALGSYQSFWAGTPWWHFSKWTVLSRKQDTVWRCKHDWMRGVLSGHEILSHRGFRSNLLLICFHFHGW